MATSSSSGVSGFTSSFDWRSFVSQMVSVERVPQQRVRAEQADLNKKRDAIGSLVTALNTLQERAKALSDANLFNSRTVSVTNSTVGLATASAANKALTGGFTIEVVDTDSNNLKTGPWKGASITGSPLTAAAIPATLTTKLSEIDPTAAATGSLVINTKTVPLTASNTLAEVITAINGAAAGVSARFDTVNGRIILTSTSSSDQSSVDVGASDYARSLSLDAAGGLKSSGVPLLYRIDGGSIQSSASPILTESQTGLVGLSVTVAPGKLGTIDLTSSQDTSKMRGAINDFIDAHNKVQAFIGTQAAVTTSSDGKVTSGVLAFDSTIADVASRLRRMLTSSPTGAPSDLPRLDRLGFTSGSSNNQITLSDSAKLEGLLKTNPEAVKAFFTTATTGLASLVGTFSGRLADSTTGSLVEMQTKLQKRSAALDTQLASMERQVLLTQERLTSGFVSMERVQAKLNQQLQYLQQRFQ